MSCEQSLIFSNGEKMPSLGLGTWMAPDAEIEAALHLALDVGYRHIDAAPVYGNEKAIGRVLKEWLDSGKIKREELFITSKLPPPGNRPESVEKYLRATIEDLQLPYIDLYLIHTPFTVPEIDGPEFAKHPNGDVVLEDTTDHIATWKIMEEMVSLGLTKSIGVSNFNIDQMNRLLANCTLKPANLQVEMHIYFQQNEIMQFCKDNAITVTAYAPLGSKGIAALNEMSGITRELPDLLENPTVLKLASEHKKTPAQILLRWITQRGAAAIPKSTNPKRLQENLDIFGFNLIPDDMDALSKLDAGIRVCDFAFFQGIDKHPEFPW